MEPVTDTTLLLLLSPLVALELLGKIVALVSVLKSPADAVRGPRGAWVAVILLVSLFGWLAWFLLGKRPR